MPRKLRTHFYQATYHVIVRGNNRQKLFFCKKEYQQFIAFIKEAIENFKFKVHSYCLMPNHVHLIIEVSDIPLAKIMRDINYRYARWFNCQHDRASTP